MSTDLICTIDDLGEIGIGLGTGLWVGFGVLGFLVGSLVGFLVCGGVGPSVGCVEGDLDGNLVGFEANSWSVGTDSKFSCSSSGKVNSIIDSSTLAKVWIGF